MSETQRKKIPNADLIKAVRNHKKEILRIYEQADGERPLLLLDFQHLKIHSHPYEDYKRMLRDASRDVLDKEYVKAIAKNKVLILVWDSATRRLVTTTFRRA
jgi:hypothetical protein